MTEDEREKLEQSFKYHPPMAREMDSYQALRDAGKHMATLVMVCCPESRERLLAITKLEEAVMWANKAIAVNG
jgi:hypothetical protein